MRFDGTSPVVKICFPDREFRSEVFQLLTENSTMTLLDVDAC
jgi:hypothetical protein